MAADAALLVDRQRMAVEMSAVPTRLQLPYALEAHPRIDREMA